MVFIFQFILSSLNGLVKMSLNFFKQNDNHKNDENDVTFYTTNNITCTNIILLLL